MDAFQIDAPAKINLSLDILGKRPDGYHELCMVMQSVTLHDTLVIRRAGTGVSLTCADSTVPCDGRNLILRAAEAFTAATGIAPEGLSVELIKRTPSSAGLAGGSADAAALLRSLRTLYCPDMTQAALEAIGLQVGSDVPFCLRGGTVLARGRGEVMEDLPSLPPWPVVLCKPDFGISTPMLFGRVRVKELQNRPDTAGLLAAVEEKSLCGVAERLCNVFEEVLPPECAGVFAIRDRLRELGAVNAVMSGSGSTVFGIFDDEGKARRAYEALSADYRETFLETLSPPLE